MSMELNILPTDTRFANSPAEGQPDCICSRCANLIAADEFALRIWDNPQSWEYRYCPACIPSLFSAPQPPDPSTYRPGIELIQAGTCPIGAQSPIACWFCPCGHPTECHYPNACAAARCAHSSRQSQPPRPIDYAYPS